MMKVTPDRLVPLLTALILSRMEASESPAARVTARPFTRISPLRLSASDVLAKPVVLRSFSLWARARTSTLYAPGAAEVDAVAVRSSLLVVALFATDVEKALKAV